MYTRSLTHTAKALFSLSLILVLLMGLCLPVCAFAEADPSAPEAAEAAPAEAAPAADSGSSLRDEILSALSDVGDSDVVEIVEEAAQVAEEAMNSGTPLINVDVSDVDADLHDNPIEHDITVDNDFLNNNSIEHDWSVNIDNSRFNNNTIIHTRTVTPRTPGTYVPGSSNPKTGDLNNATVWIAAVSVSALALAAVVFFLLRKRKKG